MGLREPVQRFRAAVDQPDPRLGVVGLFNRRPGRSAPLAWSCPWYRSIAGDLVAAPGQPPGKLGLACLGAADADRVRGVWAPFFKGGRVRYLNLHCLIMPHGKARRKSWFLPAGLSPRRTANFVWLWLYAHQPDLHGPDRPEVSGAPPQGKGIAGSQGLEIVRTDEGSLVWDFDRAGQIHGGR